MKKIIVFCLFLLGAVSYSQKLDCTKFKNGKFAAPAFPDEYAIRKDSIEEGYFESKLQTVWSVKWLSDCKLEKICIKNLGADNVKIGDKSVAEIIYTDDQCVTYSIVYFNEENPNGIGFQRGVCLQKE
ncbi:hypothetical protein BSF41_24010 [Flavobacterium sp. ACN2]|jgi:hypothetical protein|uniref:hypothetical protein n=1 Tax=unclassified Flavobacterium TaxID=196869 RepID=UPI000BB2E6CC|nr:MULTISPECIES: hypothetical protein [unclassified Flavobacterium]MDY0989289.1 hypothetical protein [Flavobacterium sp. CFBP9031]PBI89032.1 hypothetical protein BSF41_24010 [Flavobacterium sp. ACN2]